MLFTKGFLEQVGPEETRNASQLRSAEAADWLWSSFRQYVEEGFYDPGWERGWSDQFGSEDNEAIGPGEMGHRLTYFC